MKPLLTVGFCLLVVSFFFHYHFLGVLLCLEGATLMLVFGLSSLLTTVQGHIVFLFLLLGVTEAALGLSILVSISRASAPEKALLA